MSAPPTWRAAARDLVRGVTWQRARWAAGYALLGLGVAAAAGSMAGFTAGKPWPAWLVLASAPIVMLGGHALLLDHPDWRPARKDTHR